MKNHSARLRTRLGVTAIAAALMATTALGVANLSASAQSADATPVPVTTISTVNVTGVGTVYVDPDTATVTVGIDVIKPTLSEAQTDATAQMSGVMDALTAAGIKSNDIQTTNYSVNIIRNYDDTGTPGDITGFQISNQVNVTIRDISKLGEILDVVVAQGANSIWGISFFVSDPTEASSQARIAAVEQSRQIAEELAAASGMQLGRLVMLTENSSGYYQPIYGGKGAGDSAGSAVPIATGSTQISISVSATYELIES